MKKLIYLLILFPFLVKAQAIPQGVDSIHYMMPKYSWTKAQTDSIRRVDSVKNKSAYQIKETAGSGISIINGVVTNTSPDQTVSISAGNGVSITGTYPNFTIAVVQPTISMPTRALNTSFTPNTTKATLCIYDVTLSVTNPILAGTSSCTAILQYSTDGGTTWKSAPGIGQSSNVGVTVTLQLTQGQTGFVMGFIPANALAKIVTTTSGTASVSIGTCEEIVY